jgi:hypothetical protein
VWSCVVLTFFASVMIDWPRRAFHLHYPTWLRWIDYTLATGFFVALAAFLVLRGRDVVAYRRQQPSH